MHPSFRRRNRSRYRQRTRYSGAGAGLPFSELWDLIGQDTFTGTNGDDLSARSPELGTWTGTTFEIQSNTAAPTGGTGVTTMEGDAAGRVHFTVPTIPSLSAEVSVVMHYIDANNYMAISNVFTVWVLSEITASAVAQTINLGVTAANNDTFQAVLGNGQVSVFINGSLRGVASGIAAGKQTEATMGFRNSSTGTVGRFDVWELYAPAPLA
jgi:hypothetical protein